MLFAFHTPPKKQAILRRTTRSIDSMGAGRLDRPDKAEEGVGGVESIECVLGAPGLLGLACWVSLAITR